MSEEFKSGFVSLVGRPNVGKSTLLNRILGEKISITSSKPQTTRNRIQGIHNVTGGQIIFIDTPGIHQAKSKLNRSMVEAAVSCLREVDSVVLVLDAGAPMEKEEAFLQEVLSGAGAPVILALNKIDLVPPEKVAEEERVHAASGRFASVLPVSAVTGEGVERLVEEVFALLPEGPLYFPDDILTDLPERFIAAEIVREKIFRLTKEEIPYATAVEVESFKERPNGVIAISAVITVERDTQKGIVIGKGGALLKKIGTEARQEIEALLDAKVFLELFVRVRRNWTEDDRMLKELGYK